MRERGFEKISIEQFNNDFSKYQDVGYDDVILPRRGTGNAAGYDFFAPFAFVLKKGERMIVPTGIKAYMGNDEYLAIISRSSVGFKYNVRLCNQVGIIDADYYNNETNEGHILIAFSNEGENDWLVEKGSKIAQGIFHKYLLIDNEEEEMKIRIGGIGSTN